MMRPDDPFDRVEQWFNQFTFGNDVAGTPSSMFSNADIRDDGDAFVVTMDLPGYTEDAIDITASGRTLSISVDSVETDGAAEHRHGTQRTIRLPASVDETNASAEYNNGLLTVTLPKLSDESGTNIPIG